MIDNTVEQSLSFATFSSQKPEELKAGVYHISALEPDTLRYAFVGGTYEFGDSSVYPDRPKIQHDVFEITKFLSLCGYEVCLVLQVEHARWEQEFKAFNQKVAAHTTSMAGASIDVPCFVYLAGCWAGTSAASSNGRTPPSAAGQPCLFVTNIPGGTHELSIVELVRGLKHLFLALDMAVLALGTHKQRYQEIAHILHQHCSLTFFTFSNAADDQFVNQLTTNILDTLLKPEKIERRRLVLRSNQFPRSIRQVGQSKGHHGPSHPLPYTVLSAPATAVVKFVIERLNPKKHELKTSIAKTLLNK